MNETKNVIGGRCLPSVWGEMVRQTRTGPHDPLLIVLDVDKCESSFNIRSLLCAALDRVLEPAGFPTVRETSNTIFPFWMWQRRGRPAHQEFFQFVLEEYLPRYKARCRKRGNKIRESYFERMIAYPYLVDSSTAADPHTNQLAHVIEYCRRHLSRQRPRVSAVQLGLLDPRRDHNFSLLSGFPCLQQVGLTFEPDRKTMTLHAFFPSQYVIERALGNYIGLLNLGQFIANEIGGGVHLSRLCSYVGHAILKGTPRKGCRPVSANDVDKLIETATSSSMSPANE